MQTFSVFTIRMIWISLAISFMFSFSQHAAAQVSDVYINLTGTYNTFVNTDYFEIDRHRFLPSIQIGLGIFLSEQKKSRILVETGYGVRGFYKEYPHIISEYTFPTFSSNVRFAYPIYEKLYVEGGLGLDLYQSFFKENGYYVELGKGKRNTDLVIMGGVNYKPIDQLAIGLQMKYGFIPMFAGKAVSDYGDLSTRNGHINMCAGEIYLRVFLYNRKPLK